MCCVLVAEGEPRIGGEMASNSNSMDELVVGAVVVSGMVEAGTDGSWTCIRGFLISLSACRKIRVYSEFQTRNE